MYKIISIVLSIIFLGCGLAYASATAQVNSSIDWTSLVIENEESAGVDFRNKLTDIF
ncbi:MAG: hypothetical protein JW943_06245 [Deltaproteobacteria bacterium]|nr:hypothetical protein [Deltaproteobacteria bacterium]